jgi:hypothetical protein
MLVQNLGIKTINWVTIKNILNESTIEQMLKNFIEEHLTKLFRNKFGTQIQK